MSPEERSEPLPRQTTTSHAETYLEQWPFDLGDGHRGYHWVIFNLSNPQELVDFRFEQQVFLDGEWWPVVRYRWEAATIEVDTFAYKGSEPVKTEALDADYSHVEEGYDAALDMLYNSDAEFEARLRRYVAG